MSNTIGLLNKAFSAASASFNQKSLITVEENYIDHLSADKKGVYIFIKDFKMGMFVIEHENKLMAFLPKLDDGDRSVGLSSSFYDGFECHEADIVETNMTKFMVNTYLKLIEITMLPMIANLLENESLKMAQEY